VIFAQGTLIDPLGLGMTVIFGEKGFLPKSPNFCSSSLNSGLISVCADSPWDIQIPWHG
jgi:hypothetical protein